MKKCVICKEEKSPQEFNKNKTKKDGLNNICRDCSKEKSAQYFINYKEYHKEQVGIRREKLRKENREKLMYLLKISKCVDCGNTDHRTFEFDHLYDKFANVPSLAANGYLWRKIQDEINKCEILCANCHRIRTFNRSHTYRNIEGLNI